MSINCFWGNALQRCGNTLPHQKNYYLHNFKRQAKMVVRSAVWKKSGLAKNYSNIVL